MAARASVVIPIYQRMDLTRACLAALERAGLDGVEVVLVDNASTDGMNVLLDEWESAARVIRNAENLGFATACNQGAEAATAPVVVFLNTDTEVQAGWLDPLMSAVEDPAVGFAGPRLLYPNGRVQHCGMALLPGCIPFHIHRGVPGDHPVATQTRDLAILTAACAAIRRETFRGAGGFDTGYRNGFEDTDLCLNLATRGLVARYCGDSVVTHYESMSPGRLDHDVNNMARFRARWRTWTPDFSRRLHEDGIDETGPGTTLWVGPLFDESPEADFGRSAVVALTEQGLAPVVRETVIGSSAPGVGADCPPEVVTGLNRWALAGPGLRCFQHIGAGGEFSSYDAMGSSVAVLGPGAVGDIAGIRSADAVVAIGRALAESAATIAPERTQAAVDGCGVEAAAAAVLGAAPRVRAGVGWLGPALGAGTTADLARTYLAALASTGRPVRLAARDEASAAAVDLPALGRQDFEPAVWIAAAEWDDPAGPDRWEQTALSLARPLIGVTVPAEPVPSGWVAACESVCEVWVPTDEGRRALVEAGVDAEKVVVIAATVNPDHFSPNPEVPADPFTVVAEVNWDVPVGWETVLRSWVQEFSADDPVRLVLYGPDEVADAPSRVVALLDDLGCDAAAIPDVELLLEPLSSSSLAEVYGTAHAAIVIPSYDPAELRLARAAACGLVVLRPDSDLRAMLRRCFDGPRALAPPPEFQNGAAVADSRLGLLLG